MVFRALVLLAMAAPVVAGAAGSSHAQPYPYWQPCVQFGGEIAAAAARHNLNQSLLAAMAAQETGSAGHDSGSNIIGDQGHGFGLLQIDNRGVHQSFAEGPNAMVPAYNADYAATFLEELLSKYDERGSVSAYNAGLPTRCGSKTSWPGDPQPLCYADSVYRHQTQISNLPNPCRIHP
jgi:hypothetical protein